MITATTILTELRERVAPHLGTTFLKEGRALEELPIKIEYKGVVGDLEVVSIYFVPAGEDTPAALHIEVEHDHGDTKPIPVHRGVEDCPGSGQPTVQLHIDTTKMVSATNWAGARSQCSQCSRTSLNYEGEEMEDHPPLT